MTPPRAKVSVSPVRRAFYAVVFLAFTIVASGCPCVNSIVNASPGLRWWLFSTYGAERVCPEMLKTSVPLRLQDASPAVGRFFPQQCSYQVNEQAETIVIHIQGTGYAYLPSVKRVGFQMNVSVEYRPDFRIEGDDLYLWGRLQRVVAGPELKMGFVENKLIDAATALTPLGGAANLLGTQVVNMFLGRGFTVVHNEDRGNEFSLGVIQPPARPFKPFQVDEDDEAFTFANETVDVHTGQRDYLGPFEITDSDQSLSMRMSVVGNPAEVLIVPKPLGDVWRDAYQLGNGGPPPGQIMAGTPVGVGTTMRRFKLPPGLYYVVVDNTSTAGNVNPPITLMNPLIDPAIRFSYVAQLVEDD